MDSKQRAVVSKTAAYARRTLGKDATGHDWLHIRRVWENARVIAKGTGADMYVVELAALLHDIADWKFHGGDASVGPRRAAAWLRKMLVPAGATAHVTAIVAKTSFKGAKVADEASTLEARIVQDADRLDALGAIGIARTFAYGGAKGRAIYDPRVKPVLHASARAYSKGGGPTLNHFYEKLLLLKDRMHTPAGRRMAGERHRFMEEFLRRFHREVGGRRSRAILGG